MRVPFFCFYRTPRRAAWSTRLSVAVICIGLLFSCGAQTDLGVDAAMALHMELGSSAKDISPHNNCDTDFDLDFPGSDKICQVDPLFSGKRRWLVVDVELTGNSAFQTQKYNRLKNAHDRDNPQAAMREAVRDLRDVARTRQDQVIAVQPETGFRLRFRYPLLLGFSAAVNEAGLKALAAHPDVRHVHGVEELSLQTREGRSLLYAPQVNTAGYTGNRVGIAVIDSGVAYDHICFGWHGSFPNDKIVGGATFRPGHDVNADAMQDVTGHGTACAAIAAGEPLSFMARLSMDKAKKYNGGIAPEAGIYALKLHQHNGRYALDEIIRALQWCANPLNSDPETPLLVVNISMGTGKWNEAPDEEQRNFWMAVQDCRLMGQTVFASTGNQGYRDGVTLPAALSNVIGVGAVYDEAARRRAFTIVNGRCLPPSASGSKDGNSGGCVCADYQVQPGQVCCYSNTHPALTELFAPAALTSTAYRDGQAMVDNFGGTSAASAYAAGATAVLQDAAKINLNRYLLPHEVQLLLQTTGDPVLMENGETPAPLRGRLINLQRAVAELERMGMGN